MNRADVVRAVRNLGQRDAVFQFPALRERLGIKPDDKNGASQLHNWLKQLIGRGAVEIVPGTRERNRYYRIKDEEKLRQFSPVVVPVSAPENGSPRSTSASDRLGRIEDRLARLEALFQGFGERLEQIDGHLSNLAAVWA